MELFAPENNKAKPNDTRPLCLFVAPLFPICCLLLLFAGDDITYIAVLAEHRQEAFRAISETLDELKRDPSSENMR
jgi:hypothetical protein